MILAVPLALFLLFDPNATRFGRTRTSIAPWSPPLCRRAKSLLAVATGSQPFGCGSAPASAAVLDHLTHPLEFVGGRPSFPALLIAAPLSPRRLCTRTAL